MPTSPFLNDTLDRAWWHQTWDPLQAQALATTALNDARAAGDAPGTAEALLNLAYFEGQSGSEARARAHMAQARTLLAELPHPRLHWLAEFAQYVITRRGPSVPAPLAALDALEAAAPAALGELAAEFAPRTSSMRAWALHKKLGDYEAALRQLFETVRLARVAGHRPCEVNALNTLGACLIDLYDFTDAIPILRDALDQAAALDMPLVVGLAACNLAVCYGSVGRHDEMWALVSTHLIGHEDDYPCDPLLLDTVIARACLETGRLEEAEAALQSPRHAANERLGINGNNLPMWSWVAAELALRRGQPGVALGHCLDALGPDDQTATREIPPDDVLLLYQTAARAHEQLGDLRAALHCERQARTVFERLAQLNARARVVTQQVRHDVEQATAERDIALLQRQASEQENTRQAALNERLQQQIAENEVLHQRLLEQAVVDPLTGLHNRRYLYDAGSRLIDLALRKQAPIALVLMDIDHFKQINDRFGHMKGDAVLNALAGLIRTCLRETDVICRFGGDEIVLLLPDATAEDAEARTRAVLVDFNGLSIADGGEEVQGCTFSAGIATCPGQGTALGQLLSAADGAAYQAKRAGRGRVVVADTCIPAA